MRSDVLTEDNERSTNRLLLIIGAVVAALIIGAAAMFALSGGSETAAVDPEVLEPTATLPEGFEPSANAEVEPTSDTAPSTVPVSAVEGAIETGGDEVPESRGVVKNGQIILEGAVPDRASADAIVALAGDVLGPDNVIDNYTIDPRAGDPSLGSVRVDDHVLFQSNSAVLAPEFEPLILQAVGLMTIRPQVTMTIFGHTDNLGTDAENLALSQARAQSIVDYMAGKGIDPARLTAVGKGEGEPVADNATAQGREQNRRIEVEFENLLGE